MSAIKVAIVGSNELANYMLGFIKSSDQFEFVGFLDDFATQENIKNGTLLGNTQKLLIYIKRVYLTLCFWELAIIKC